MSKGLAVDAPVRDLGYVIVPAVPAAGSAVEIVPGIHWVRLPLPFRLDHINVWLLEDGPDWVLVDTGINLPMCIAAWEHLGQQYLPPRRLRRILVTHHHSDHFGLAGWLAETHGARIVMSARALARARHLRGGHTPLAQIERFYTQHGLQDLGTVMQMARGNIYLRMTSGIPDAVEPIGDGELLAIGSGNWQVIEVHGHAEGHLVLYDAARRVAIVGDQALPDISANVSVYPIQPDADPLSQFIASFERLAALPEGTLILPSHGVPYRHLDARLSEMRAHHAQACAVAQAACGTPQTATAVLPHLFPRALDEFNYVLALGETVAHLNHLVARGTLSRGEGADGRVYFAARPGAA